VLLDKMADAENAVLDAAAKIPAEVSARLETADKLSEEDRKAIIEIARQAVTSFQPKPDSKPKAAREAPS
jgi:F-type H+-transporting ATPase subunit alpha